METETQSAYSTETLGKPAASATEESGTEEDMAPLENDAEMPNHQNGVGTTYMAGEGHRAKYSVPARLMSDEGEDGEILEDGEIASDDGGLADDGEVGEEDIKSQSSSPTKKSHKDDRDRHGKNKRDRHSKRRRSKEDGHRDKQQKKKRHREYVDYDKAGDEDPTRDTGDKKGGRSPLGPYHSPSHDSHGEERGKHDKDGDKHRRGSGDNRHHGRDRTRDKDKNRDSRERSRDRHDGRKDKHDKDKKERKDRDSHRDKDYKPYQHSDSYESPPGIYDSPSDEEYSDRFGGKKPKTMMSLVEGDYMDPTLAPNENERMLPKNKKKMLKKKEWQERVRQREREREFDEENPPPVKKKPLLQTPMEERPVCKFFKEGKCQKGVNCLFKHDYKELPKRLELCRFYLKSYCRQEEECPFMHSEFPCKYFHTGSTCYQGDNCKFSHDPLTPETDEALRNALNENEEEEHFDGYDGPRKHKKKGLLGDQPQMSEEEIHRKLEHMKKIPSIFDIETFAPGESPSKQAKKQPPPGQSPSGIRPQGYYQDANMSPQGGPNMRFNGPPNQGPPPPFMQGPGGPGMDGPPPGMQGPMGNQGLMGPGPPPPMGPGMQGAPMGPPPNMNPPMSQAAALVGALLRAAPMLQRYGGPNQPGPQTSMANTMGGDGMMMSSGGMMMGPNQMNQMQGTMGPGPNMMTGPPPNMTQAPPPPMLSPGQQDGMMNQGSMMPDNQGQEGFNQDAGQQQPQQASAGMSANIRDPRRSMAASQDPRLNKDSDKQEIDMDVDMRDADSTGGLEVMMDIDLRQDVDMRLDDTAAKGKKGNTTPQQDWDDDVENKIDDSDIPSHLPPKQREMFLRIKQHQHTMKINAQKAETQKLSERETTPQPKADDDKWYSSDEEEDVKPNISNILKNLNQNEIKKEPGVSEPPASVPSSINVMQMINAIKSSAPSDSPTYSSPRRVDPRLIERPREPAMIFSKDGDCPWRLCRVVYTKQRIPNNLELADSRYKNDPRVQKILKLQELESGVLIDHSKASTPIKSEKSTEQRPSLLDPKILQKQVSLPRPELAPFVDPRKPVIKVENVDPRVKQEPQVARPQDPRMKPAIEVKPIDPRVQKLATHNLPVKPMDPRLSRQDSNNASAIGRVSDPRLSRQNSREPDMGRSPTPPLDPRSFNRQTSIDPRIQRTEAPPTGVNLPKPADPRPSLDPRSFNRQTSGDPRIQRTETPPINASVNLPKPADPRLGRVLDLDVGPPSVPVQRQMSQPSTLLEKDAASSNPQKPKLDYRNDPRFKRKHISESNIPPEALGKRFTGQRKSSTEYSSPLGDEAGKQEESGYNSYNRPRPPLKSQLPPLPQSMAFSEGGDGGSPDITTHDILDSIQIMPPPALEPPPAQDKNLKDIFKTIDPTASPFC